MLPRRQKVISVIALIAIIALVVFLISFFGGDGPEEVAGPTIKEVRVASVAKLSGDATTLVVVGDLRAAAQADLRAEKGGRVTRVNYKAGDRVPAGAIIAELENAAERARVLSAQGSLQGAEAALAKLIAGDRPEEREATQSALESANQSFSQAQLSAVTAFRQGYAAAQSAVEANADTFFRDVETINPKLVPTTQQFQTSEDIEQERVAIGDILEQWQEEVAQIDTGDDLSAAVTRGQQRLERINAFLNDISRVIAAQTEFNVSQATIDSQQAVIASARASANAGLGGLAQARTALANASLAKAQAESGVEINRAGARSEDIAGAQANVTSARGAVASAAADLDSTRIRAPFAGIISSLSVTQGKFVTAQEPAATVVSEAGDAWVVETFVSPEDRSRIESGALATIADIATGTVSTIAPGVDPATQKVRVDINLSSKPETLAPGQTVRAAIKTNASSSDERSVAIPLSALKLTPDSAFVFTVNASSTLVAREVKVGTVSGDRAVIESGLTPEIEIVVDARGRREGETVSAVRE